MISPENPSTEPTLSKIRWFTNPTIFWLVLLIGLIGILEAGAAMIYFMKIPQQQRDLIETALGAKTNDHSLLRYQAHPYLNFTGNPDFHFANGAQAHNALGFRNEQCCTGKPPEGLLRILAMGGSTTFGWRFSFPNGVWPAILKTELEASRKHPIEVINMGMPFYTTFEQLGVLTMLAPEFSPHIILFHMGLNDAFSVGYQDEGGPDNRFFRHAYSYKPIQGWTKTAMESSYLFRLIGMRVTTPKGAQIGDLATVIQYPVPPQEQLQQNIHSATGKYFHRNLKTMVALAKHLGAIPVLINMPLNPQFEEGQDIYHSGITKAVLRNNEISKTVAEEEGLLYIDLYTRMRDPRLFTDAAHASKRGMAMKAVLIHRALDKNLSTQGILQPASSN